MLPSFFPFLLIMHNAFAVTLFLPSLLLPFALRAGRATETSPSHVMRGLIGLQGQGTRFVGAGLVVTGVGLVAVLGASVLSQPWLLVAIAIYALNLLAAFFIQRPNLRALLGIRGAMDERVWKLRARRQRYVSYVMAGMVGMVAVLMSQKPLLW